jgi:hypothetical protein
MESYITCCVVLSGTSVVDQFMLDFGQRELLGAEDSALHNTRTTGGRC